MSEVRVPDAPATIEATPPFGGKWVSALEGVFHEEVFFLILSVFIGIFSGLAVVCFRLAIDWTHLALLGPLPQAHSWRLFAVPSLAGLVIAFLVMRVFPGVRGSGVNQTKA